VSEWGETANGRRGAEAKRELLQARSRRVKIAKSRRSGIEKRDLLPDLIQRDGIPSSVGAKSL
jgi:hypothetical protein